MLTSHTDMKNLDVPVDIYVPGVTVRVIPWHKEQLTAKAATDAHDTVKVVSPLL